MNNPFIPQKKLWWHEDRVHQILYEHGTEAPVTVEIYPTYYCNLRCHFCFGKNTKVLMADWTLKNISCIEIGDLLMGWDIKQKNTMITPSILRPVKVTNIHNHPALVGELIHDKYRTVCTGDHKILGNLNDKDRRNNFVSASRIGTARALPQWNYERTPAWWHGWLCGVADGDGCFWTLKGKVGTYRHFRLALTGKGSAPILPEFIKRMNDFGYPAYMGKHRFKGFLKEATTCDAAWLTTHNQVVAFEQTWNRFHTKNGNKEFYAGYLAGMIDTDGCVRHGAVRISQFKLRIKERIRTALTKLHYKFVDELNGFRILLGAGTRGRRTRARIITESTPRHPVRFAALLRERAYISQTCSWCPLFDQGTVTVYDITTETGTFVADGMYVKNCDFKHTNLQTKKVAIDTKLLLKTIKDMDEVGVRGINWGGGGEPSLHHNLPAFIDAVAQTNMTQGIFTNGALLTNKLISKYLEMEWVRFSINAGTPRLYRHVHGAMPAMFHKVLQNLTALVDEKKRTGSETTVGVSMVVNGHNYRSVRTLGDLVADIGVDYFQIRPDSSASPEFIPVYYNHIVDAIQDARWKDIVRLTQYRWLDVQSPPYFGRNYSRCRAPWLISAIGAEGKVWPCSEMAGVEGEELGDLHDKSFGEIFTKPNIEAFIARKNPKTCRRICKGHETNKALHHIYHIEKESHPNHL